MANSYLQPESRQQPELVSDQKLVKNSEGERADDMLLELPEVLQ